MPADTSSSLPGFEALVRPIVDRPAAQDLTNAQRYTAESVIRDYPDVAQAAARALFYHRLPVSTVADLFRMSKATVAAIRDRVIAESGDSGAAPFFIRSRVRSQRDILISRLMDALQDRLSSPSALEDITTKELAEILTKLDSAAPASNGTERVANSPHDVTIIQASEFDDVLNGFGGGKKGAAIGGAGADGVGADGGDRTALTDGRTALTDGADGLPAGDQGDQGQTSGAPIGADEIERSSFSMSASSADYKGFSTTSCNTSCNARDIGGAASAYGAAHGGAAGACQDGGQDGGQDGAQRGNPPPAGAANDTPGGRGVGGAARAGALPANTCDFGGIY